MHSDRFSDETIVGSEGGSIRAQGSTSLAGNRSEDHGERIWGRH